MDEWAYWRSALALVGDGGKLTKAQAGDLGGITMEPRPGFWRKPVTEIVGGKRWRRPSLPVAIWRDLDGAMHARVNGVPGDAEEIWTWCAMCPVSYETYQAVGERGELWPEGIE